MTKQEHNKIHQEIKHLIKEFNETSAKNEIQHNFVTESSKYVSKQLISTANNKINHNVYVVKLNDLIFDFDMSTEIENGIFEFALIHVTFNNLHEKLLLSIYNDKFNEIMLNLDTNSRLKNKTLRPLLKSKLFKPQLIAFLSPQHLHPKKWANEVKKKECINDREKNMATTDIYTCNECGESKCSISQLQTRGSDEPMTTFITCCVCYVTQLLND
jgi:DNA-directed RNA polymerase subunit M/transcription elongation factor TFIIS